MTLAAPAPGTAYNQNNLCQPTTILGAWTTLVSDAQATAATAPEQKAPLTFAGSSVRWVAVPPGAMRLALRCKFAATTVTTSPIVRVYGAWPPPPTTPDATTNQFATGGTVPISRLDSTQTGTAITLTCTIATDISDGTYQYSDPTSWTSPVTTAVGDLCGCSYVCVLVTTAANVSGGSDTIEVQGLFL